MDKKLKLEILKKDLQMTSTNANDSYLEKLLELGEAAVIREGIAIKEDSIEIDMAAIHYAAYLYRKRAGKETAMPRYLRYELNNILFSQKGKAEKKE